MFYNTLRSTSVMHHFIGFQQHTWKSMSNELFLCTVS